MSLRARSRVLTMALAVLLPLVASAAHSQGPYRPPSPDTPPPDSGRTSGGSTPFIPSISLSFTIKPPKEKPKPAEAWESPREDQTSDTAILLLRAGPDDPQALAGRAGVVPVEVVPLESIGLTMVVGKLGPGDTVAAVIARSNTLPGVVWAQANHVYQGMGRAQSLPKGYELQGLTADVMATPATGIIAMIDTAVDLGHEALAGAAIQQQLFAAPMTPGVHGTAVADLIVGRGQIPGSGQGARLVSLAAFQQSGPDGPALSQTRYIAKALDGAARLRPNVLNLSFGGPSDRLLDAMVDAIAAKGVCMVAAAGNGGKSGRPPFPATHPAVLGVTAVDERLRIYSHATPGPQVDVAAIGVDLTAAAPGGYRRMSGSSFAAATVSGALLRTPACGRSRNPVALQAAVAAAARDLGAPGRDEVFGAGLFRLPR